MIDVVAFEETLDRSQELIVKDRKLCECLPSCEKDDQYKIKI